MLTTLRRCAVVLVLFAAAPALAEKGDGYAADGSKQCLGCHDFGPESPVHAVLAGSHGPADDMQDRRGCEDCHGPSANHARAPTRVSPGVSYGPRWTATTKAQDRQCLTCHEQNVAQHWSAAPHQLSEVTCVACHDIHTDRDRVLFSERQGEVCTICHKAQKSGIHGIGEKGGSNPACSTCHNSHDHASPVTEMLGNRSEGCRTCHDLVRMAVAKEGTEKARSYHKVMAQADRTCLDCHQQIAHAAPSSAPPIVPVAMRSREITLFYPGQSDSEWLRTAHPGSQPLRQGTGCQQCHRGEEAEMGKTLAAGDDLPARQVTVTFSHDASTLQVQLAWAGDASDADIAMMWGDRSNPVFQRAGCFAACHNDMPGMTRDRGQQTGKYLLASRIQEQRIGQPALTKDSAALAKLMAEGNFIEMWRVDLASGKVESAALLDRLEWHTASEITAQADYRDGRWTVRIARPLGQIPGLKSITADGRYTFGIALHGADRPGSKHWISLPMTLGLSADHTDFRAE